MEEAKANLREAIGLILEGRSEDLLWGCLRTPTELKGHEDLNAE